MFNILNMLDRPWESIDHRVADQVSSYWVGFAKTSDPNGEGRTHWPVFDATDDAIMHLGEKMGPMPTADPEKIAYWKMVLSKPSK